MKNDVFAMTKDSPLPSHCRFAFGRLRLLGDFLSNCLLNSIKHHIALKKLYNIFYFLAKGLACLQFFKIVFCFEKQGNNKEHVGLPVFF